MEHNVDVVSEVFILYARSAWSVLSAMARIWEDATQQQAYIACL